MSVSPDLVVVDYGMGNRRSVEKALERAGARVAVTADHAAIRAADGVVVPGVGAFPRAMENLRRLGLDDLLRERAAAGVPLLGICLGMQLLFDSSVELGGAEGLGLIPGTVEVLDTAGARLPHIGWNLVRFERAARLIAGLPGEAAFYHVHSYAPACADASHVLGTAEYGTRFTTAVARDNVAVVQFHPEKSSTHGLRLLGGFVGECAAAEAAAA
ncbi:MAG TPA: imidazole glycerol phosphate synthase subunit HisH [Solirubrobacteraceae bacterium]